MLGIINKNSRMKTNFRRLNTIHPEPNYSLLNNQIYLVAGGLKNMCISNINEKSKGDRFIALGLGITKRNDQFDFMKLEDWQSILSDENADLTNLNGHFVTVLIKDNKVIIRNDQLGLRNIYWLETDDFIGFSSRLDWLSKIIDNSEINFKSFSSFWNLFISLSNKSSVKGINKLNPGGKLIISEDNKVENTHNYWHPNITASITGNDPISLLRDLTLFPIKNDRKIILALSGGIDSRTLLSFLLSEEKINWKTVTWGNNDSPDTIIAKKLANFYNFEHLIMNSPYQNEEACVSKLYKFISETYSFYPAYTFKELGYCSTIVNAPIYIDGGSGGFFRRSLSNKMLMTGKKFLINGDIENTYNIMKEAKADIFDKDMEMMMYEYTLNDIEKMFKSMPSIDDFGVENWVDLLYLRYKKTTNGSIMQSKMDSSLMNYMPFIQPSLLKLVFNVDVKIRKSEKMNKNILRMNKQLTKFPIAKYETIIPYTLNLYYAYGMAILTKKIKGYQKSNLDIQFLNKIPNFVQDRIDSIEVKQYPHYNYKKIRLLVNEYYKGDTRFAGQINWWLSFDIWREIISTKSIL